VAGLLLFAGASLCCGLSWGVAPLIIARGFQGAGAAAMLATTIALINVSYYGQDRGIAFGVWGAVNGAAAAAAPIIGGLLTEGLSWRWIFFVNLPVAVAAVTLALRALPREQVRLGSPIDLPGIAAFTTATGSITYAVTRAPNAGWTAPSSVALFTVSVLALTAFAVRQLRASNPIIELSLLRRPAFAGVLVAALLFTASAFAYAPVESLWLQSVLGLSPTATGLVFAPLSVAALVVALVVGRILARTPAYLLIGAGLAVIGVGAFLQAGLNARSTWTSIVLGLAITGVGVGLATPTLASAALGAVPIQRGGMASGAVNTMRQLGIALGVAGLGVLCQARIADVLRASHISPTPSVLAAELLGGRGQEIVAHAPIHARARLEVAIHSAFASGLNYALIVAGGVGMVGAAVVTLTARGRTQPASASADGEPQSLGTNPNVA
jgi:EmrB/QacA subfamily drug resistance transporter